MLQVFFFSILLADIYNTTISAVSPPHGPAALPPARSSVLHRARPRAASAGEGAARARLPVSRARNSSWLHSDPRSRSQNHGLGLKDTRFVLGGCWGTYLSECPFVGETVPEVLKTVRVRGYRFHPGSEMCVLLLLLRKIRKEKTSSWLAARCGEAIHEDVNKAARQHRE